MNYLEPLPQQLSNFLLFFAFGFLDGFLFRLVEFVRSLFSKGKIALLVQDLFFSVATTVFMFVFFLVYADGNVRVNLIFASVLGTAVFFLTADRVVKKVFGTLSSVFSKFVSLISVPFATLSKKVKKGVERLFGRIKAQTKQRKAPAEKKKEKKLSKKVQKPENKRKKYLKKHKKSL